MGNETTKKGRVSDKMNSLVRLNTSEKELAEMHKAVREGVAACIRHEYVNVACDLVKLLELIETLSEPNREITGG